MELEAAGIKTSEREREANRERITRLRLRMPDGYTEDLEPVEASEAAESPGPTPKPVLEQSLDAVITDTSDPRHFRELASLLRTGRSLADEQRARRDARRLRRKLDREAGGYERRKDGARMSPAAFAGGFLTLRAARSLWHGTPLNAPALEKAMGGKPETLERAIRTSRNRLQREPMDFNRAYVYRAPALVERKAAIYIPPAPCHSSSAYETDQPRLRKAVNREEEPMGEYSHSREQGPREGPEVTFESLPEATTVGRQPPDSEPSTASASEEQRAGAEGAEQEAAAPSEEPVPLPEDPPRGRPSEEQ